MLINSYLKTLTYLVPLYKSLGMFDKASKSGKEALSIIEETNGQDSYFLVGPLSKLLLLLLFLLMMILLVRLGRLHLSRKNFEQASKVLFRALSICKSAVGSNHPKTADIIYEIGCFYIQEYDSTLVCDYVMIINIIVVVAVAVVVVCVFTMLTHYLCRAIKALKRPKLS